MQRCTPLEGAPQAQQPSAPLAPRGARPAAAAWRRAPKRRSLRSVEGSEGAKGVERGAEAGRSGLLPSATSTRHVRVRTTVTRVGWSTDWLPGCAPLLVPAPAVADARRRPLLAAASAPAVGLPAAAACCACCPAPVPPHLGSSASCSTPSGPGGERTSKLRSRTGPVRQRRGELCIRGGMGVPAVRGGGTAAGHARRGAARPQAARSWPDPRRTELLPCPHLAPAGNRVGERRAVGAWVELHKRGAGRVGFKA